MKERETWIDIAKGLGIIVVVISHSGNDFAYHYFFWFHMPLFFILSGYTFKEITTKKDFKAWTKRVAYRSLLPYLSFGVLIFIIYSLISSYLGKFNLTAAGEIFMNLIYGGQELTGYFGVFWFITCLLVTQVLFAFILLLFKSHIMRLLLIASCYVLAHLESAFLSSDIAIPLNADVALLAIVYYSIGWYIKTFGKDFLRSTYLLIFTTVLFLITLTYEVLYGIDYTLDMKYRVYTDWAMDLFIPVLFSFVLFQMSFGLAKIPAAKHLSQLGQMTLPIMYLHLPFNIALLAFWPNYNWLVFTIVGIALPVLFQKISEKSSLAASLFSGKPFQPGKNAFFKTIP
ncbi:acyltransferase family protein [Planococcus sp. 1R117A]|uniref:acyltransferase family protein n=1 Tax=Planococcus sp. 1R117A TaxID=3447020 RepID=UPI003EDB7514